ncbi:S49 family peptidase [Stutzerimonas urumqiensis]|uniref:S49 family peptidase n=1 Tax=Stutzerimonas urumqiensis TaxID=638269 RepID=UPI000EAD48EC|nr:S49 family peptidase [Stutzerimonas urumqiensis]
MMDMLSTVTDNRWLLAPELCDLNSNPLEAIRTFQSDQSQRLPGTLVTMVGSGIAIVHVIGPILRYANRRYVSTEQLALDIRAALDSPTVRSIVLNVDSPGGQVAGINELAELIYRARPKKRITAYVGGTAASAAYWIASAAHRIVIDETALVGGIGAVAEYANRSGIVEIVSRNAPNKRPDLSTEQGRAKVAESVDAIGEFFAKRVARNLGVKPERIAEMGKQGGLRMGADAVRAGLAHGLGSLQSVLAGKPAMLPPTQKSTQPSKAAGIAIAAPLVAPATPVPTEPQSHPEVTTASIWKQRNRR